MYVILGREKGERKKYLVRKQKREIPSNGQVVGLRGEGGESSVSGK